LKKYFLAIALIIIFLAVSMPLASNNPDGLEKVASTFGAQEHQNLWNGLIADYSIMSIRNPYVSTLLAGIFGVMIVLVATLLLGKVMLPKTVKVDES
jgi:hypothetical protein